MSNNIKLDAKKTGTKRGRLISRKPKKGFSQTKNKNSPVEQVLHLQQTIGNRAVNRLIKSGAIQAKLTIGKPNDIYEKEADRVADRVMSMKDGSLVNGHSSLAQRESTCPECPEKKEIQSKPLADQITPLVQRQPEEEEAQTKLLVQRQDEEEEKAQAKPLIQRQAEEEEAQAKSQVQRQEEEEEKAQTKPLVQRQAEEEEEKAQTKPLVQRQNEEEEEKPIQSKAAPYQGSKVTPSIESSIDSMKGGGQPLSESTRAFYEPRFGADFSHVRIHTDSRAAQTAQAINAKAFTTGKDIVFNTGQYSPGTSSGKSLMAHELTHVVQQGIGRNKIQRKIMVGGNAYTPTAKYKKWLKRNYRQVMVTMVEKMHNKGAPPIYKFDSYEAMGYELRIRNAAIKGMDEAHNTCCNYPSTQPNGYLNATYWKRNGYMDFTPKSPFPSGKESSDAVEAIFAPGAGTQLECLTMTVAVEYYSLLKGLGKGKFDKKFPKGSGLAITQPSSPRANLRVIRTPKYQYITAKRDKLLPGDWVYFKNFKDYPAVCGGYWRGENAIVMEHDKYRGFGIGTKSENDLNKELVTKFNAESPSTMPNRTVPQLIADGGGLKDYPVIRPVIKEILK